MVNDLRTLLRENVEDAPADHPDLAGLVRSGRRRLHRRRATLVGGTASVVAAVVVAAATGLGGTITGSDRPGPSNRQLEPVGPVVHLGASVPGAEGTDYDVVTSYTNENLDRANGQYLDGVTDDGLVLFRDGPHGIRNASRLALLDPATGTRDWLPDPPESVDRAVELGADRIVYTTMADGLSDLGVVVFDRTDRTWGTVSWPGLPQQRGYVQVRPGPDGRVYLGYERGGGLTRFDLWSASVTDPADVRDEHLVVGDFALEGSELTWTTTHNEPNDGVHIRDLATGEQTDFDPRSGDGCNQLSLQRTASYVAMYQYCGTHDGVRDDRVQVVTTTGEPVVTIQGDGPELTYANDRAVAVDVFAPEGGTYLYQFDSGRLVRITRSISHFGLGGAVPRDSDYVFWHTDVNHGHGATQWLGKVR